MSTNLVCLKCPFFHPAGEDCPAGWHEVPSIGGDSTEHDQFWRDMAPVMVALAVLGLMIIGLAYLAGGR